MTTFSQPAGKPHSSSNRFASLSAVNGVDDAGFNTTGQPAAIAGASLCATRFSGKLNGLIARDHPDRYPHHEAELPHAGRAGLHRDGLAAQRAGDGSREPERVNGTRRLDAGRLDGLGRLGADRCGEVLLALEQQRCGPIEDRGPLVHGQRAALVQTERDLDGLVEVRFGGDRDCADHRSVVRRLHFADVVGDDLLIADAHRRHVRGHSFVLRCGSGSRDRVPAFRGLPIGS